MDSTENLWIALALLIASRLAIFAAFGFALGFALYRLLSAPRTVAGELVAPPATDATWRPLAPLPELPKPFPRVYIAPDYKARLDYYRKALPSR